MPVIGRVAVLVVGASASLLATACGSSSGNIVKPPASSASSPPAASTTVSETSSSSSSSHGTPTITVTPNSGLAAQQAVDVRGSGFTPGEQLQVIQCADKGQATGPADCNLTGSLSVASDAAGAVHVSLPVTRGPFGANQIVCSATQKCLVSVTQASLTPTEEADAPISFTA